MKWGKIVIFSHFFIKAHRIPFPSKFAKTIKGFCVNLGAKDFIICKNISIVSIYDFCP